MTDATKSILDRWFCLRDNPDCDFWWTTVDCATLTSWKRKNISLQNLIWRFQLVSHEIYWRRLRMNFVSAWILRQKRAPRWSMRGDWFFVNSGKRSRFTMWWETWDRTKSITTKPGEGKWLSKKKNSSEHERISTTHSQVHFSQNFKEITHAFKAIKNLIDLVGGWALSLSSHRELTVLNRNEIAQNDSFVNCLIASLIKQFETKAPEESLTSHC